MPPDFMTEAGPRMQFKVDFDAREIERDEVDVYPAGGIIWGDAYRTRTRFNVRDSDVTLWFGNPSSRGGKATSLACAGAKRHFVHVGEDWTPEQLVFHFEMHPEWRIVNVAGNRESSNPGIGERVEAYLTEVFRLMSDPR